MSRRHDFALVAAAAENYKAELTRLRDENARLREALKPFVAFTNTCVNGFQMNPDHKITQGSPMAAPQLYARDFLALRQALDTNDGE